ncbi:hypothetical protein BLNAU_10300 [Blattamonas nauphoetae]|uniref:HAT C-terminal dimerisation domain-containing protein n=1 Tax=Blattamonas nauphoetae TaxID=2049346 RepID=A0ABQ9XTK5_9EUKA|nr:hypothetical protein BLNAU_10300 [Blattamonas nauphoetae]
MTHIANSTFDVGGKKQPTYIAHKYGVTCVPCEAGKLIAQKQFTKDWDPKTAEPTISSIRGVGELHKHEQKSKSHQLNIKRYQSFVDSPFVKNQKQDQRADFMLKTQERFVQLSFIEKTGNPQSFMSALQEYENDMYPGNHRQTFGYMTPGTQGRMRKVIADYLRYQNQVLLKQSDFFGLLFDESTDSSNRSQLMITICYILEGVRQFGYLGLMELGVDGGSGINIAHKIQEIVSKNDLDPNRCIGLATDGASAMVGEVKGAVTRLKSFFPNAVTTHCCAHRVSLSASDVRHSQDLALFHTVETIAGMIASTFHHSNLLTAKLHEKQKSSETLAAFASRFPAESMFSSIQIFDPAQIIKNQSNPMFGATELNVLFNSFPMIFREQERERLITDWQSLKVHFRLVHHQDTSVDTVLHSVASFVPSTLNPPRYPLLSKLARILLTIPVSTAPVESYFSIMNTIKNSNSNAMKTSTLDDKLFIRINGPSKLPHTDLSAIVSIWFEEERRDTTELGDNHHDQETRVNSIFAIPPPDSAIQFAD